MEKIFKLAAFVAFFSVATTVLVGCGGPEVRQVAAPAVSKPAPGVADNPNIPAAAKAHIPTH